MSLSSALQAAWRRRGALAVALLPLTCVYAALVLARRALFRLGLRRAQRLPVPVIVVGNVIAGGAGKTPTVIALMRHLQARGERPGVISRGYGGQAAGPLLVDGNTRAAQAGDEPLLIRRATGAPTCIGARRVEAARHLLAAHPELTVIVSDDGLQHLALERDVEVIVFDERGAGNGWWLPAGPLREGMGRRADAVLYNAPAPSTGRPGFGVRRALGPCVPLARWAAGDSTGPDLHELRGRPVLAVAGIAHPQRFFGMLAAQGLDVAPCPLPDHHDYATLPWAGWTGDAVLVTEKDAVKLQFIDAARADPRIAVVTLDFQPEPAFFTTVDDALATARRRRPPHPG